ncbi:hypothetical protein A9Q89_05130 [Gammaproteobacteria bacterium 53_120_T64]|nr:hypothetical protein A9Q89_05130 [Gammaproteobacteria bacterium 53_120_T64]
MTLISALFTFSAGILAADNSYKAPRATDGVHPDFNGIWQTMNEANYDIEMHMARPAMALRDGPGGPLPIKELVKIGAVGAVPPSLGVVEGGKIPYTPEALAIKKENQLHWLERDPEIKCYLPGVPRATYMPQPFQIFQGDDSVFITYQYAGADRDIFMKDPGLAPVDSWMGQSVASWDGDTLVVDVTGLHPGTWLDRSGNHHSDQLHVVERYTLMSPNHIQYEATLTDPKTYTKPWKISMPLYRRMESNIQLLDFKCVEFVEELLYGKLRAKPLD